MQRASELMNSQVVDLSTGKIKGRVIDLLFSLQNGAIEGLLLKLPLKRYALGFVEIKEVKSLGKDAVTVFKAEGIKKWQQPKKPAGIRFKPLMTQNGNLIGHITDVIIDENNYCVLGLEVSKSLFEDLKRGRQLWLLSPEMALGDVVLVPENCQSVGADRLVEHARRLSSLAITKTEAVCFLNRRD